MYKISKPSQKILENIIGKKYRDIVDMDCDDEIVYIQKRNKKKLKFSNLADKRKVGHGNLLLSRKRIKMIDTVKRGLSRIKYCSLRLQQKQS